MKINNTNIISDTMFYVFQDRLGSYDVITNDTGDVMERLAYDVWGNRVKWDDWTQRESWDYGDLLHTFRRGYTGHEHLGSFGIINMNGRIFDPNTASFFSPDPFVVDATSTQAFNRYSYCMNNPLMYTDPSGEFIFLILNVIQDIFSNVSNWIASGFDSKYQCDWTGTKNSWRIYGGLFQGDAKQILSRIFLEIPQTALGYLYTQGRNLGGNVDRVDYYGGVTFATNENSSAPSVSLGNFININDPGRIEGNFRGFKTT